MLEALPSSSSSSSSFSSSSGAMSCPCQTHSLSKRQPRPYSPSAPTTPSSDRPHAAPPQPCPLPLFTTTPISALSIILGLLCVFFQHTAAAEVSFQNCLPDSYRFNDPLPLQWNPLYVDARIDSDDGTHTLQVILWGNVSGSHYEVSLPPPDDEHWSDDNEQDGKIGRIPDPDDPNLTTLNTRVGFLSYTPYRENDDFCNDKLTNFSCPLGPVFNTSDIPIPYGLPSVNITNEFDTSYAFTSLTPTFLFIYGDNQATQIGCVSTVVTPDLGSRAGLIKWMPLVILVLVGFATVFASIFSPWGTTDVFRWTSNFGRDADLLRLVTPGFGDCLQYIQFVVLTGGLTINYPGFYQPIVSQAGWSVLMFNESISSDKPGWQAVQDGIYITNGTHGLQNLAQLMGMPDVEDIWVGMMVWLLVIIAGVLALTQIFFFCRWVWRLISSTPEEDLRAKNMPFSVGNVIRIVFNYFLLPVVALSTFQLVVAGESAGYAVGLAAITLIILIGFASWLFYLVIKTKPRAVLFDDLPTVLLYGPLYNTYSDEAAVFALIPVLLTFFRGIAIGAVQPFGIAQIVMLAICEVITILTIHAFHPYSSPTSMNAYHTLFSTIRFVTIMMMVAFIPELGVTEGPKGWIGYAILILHGAVLVLGFFLNAFQTILEVTARLMGARGDDGLARGGLARIFGMRQLQRRMSRRTHTGPSRQSQLSTAAMLTTDDVASKSGYATQNGRNRSESAASAVLLRNHNRNSSALDSIDALSMPARNLDSGSMFTPTTPGQASTFSFLPSPGGATRTQPAVPLEAADPYYRPPRRRGDTLSGSMTSERPRLSTADSGRYSQLAQQPADGGEGDGEAPQIERANTPAATAAAADKAPAPNPINPAPRADYATREVDFYYGVRGPALNSEGPGRKLGTGPADPTGPMASAAGWIRSMFGGKTKEKGKGFEVVRSSRMPPGMMRAAGGEFSDDGAPPEGVPVAMGVLRNGPIESDDEDEAKKQSRQPNRQQQDDLLTGEHGEDGEDDRDEDRSSDERERDRVSAMPPTLPGFEFAESIRMPSRATSKATTTRHASQHRRRQREPDDELDVPDIPRKSSKRHSGADFGQASMGPDSLMPPPSEQQEPFPTGSSQHARGSSPTNRLPFDGSHSPSSSMAVTEELSQVDLNEPTPDRGERPTSFGYVPQHSISRVDVAHDQQPDLLATSAELVDERSNASSRGERTM